MLPYNGTPQPESSLNAGPVWLGVVPPLGPGLPPSGGGLDAGSSVALGDGRDSAGALGQVGGGQGAGWEIGRWYVCDRACVCEWSRVCAGVCVFMGG